MDANNVLKTLVDGFAGKQAEIDQLKRERIPRLWAIRNGSVKQYLKEFGYEPIVLPTPLDEDPKKVMALATENKRFNRQLNEQLSIQNDKDGFRRRVCVKNKKTDQVISELVSTMDYSLSGWDYFQEIEANTYVSIDELLDEIVIEIHDDDKNDGVPCPKSNVYEIKPSYKSSSWYPICEFRDFSYQYRVPPGTIYLKSDDGATLGCEICCRFDVRDTEFECDSHYFDITIDLEIRPNSFIGEDWFSKRDSDYISDRSRHERTTPWPQLTKKDFDDLRKADCDISFSAFSYELG